MKEQLHLVFKKVSDEKTFIIRIDDPKEDLVKDSIEDAVLTIVESKVFGDLIPVRAQIITTSIENIELAG